MQIKKEFNQQYYVYSVKGAYMMTRRELFNRLGGLDKDFFIYFEESDYCGRVWTAGYTVKYIPSSVLYHWGGSDTKEDWEKRFALVQYRCCKNRLCSYLKNLSLQQAILTIPFHLIILEGLSLYYCISGKFLTAFAIQKAIVWNGMHFEDTLKKRRKIQHMRKSSDKEIFAKVAYSVSPMYYFHLLRLLHQG